MPRKPPPLSSFGPELQKALRAGSETETKITFETEKIAARFCARLNELRKAMRSANHPDTDQLYRCAVLRAGAIVTLKPRDSEFAGALKGVEISGPTPGVPVPEGETKSAVDSFLADLENKPPEG